MNFTMTFFTRRAWAAGMLAVLAAGCAGTSAVSGGDGTLSIKETPVPAQAAPKNRATVRVLPYTDARTIADRRKIGVGGENIYGLHAPTGTDILLSKDVAAVVTGAMKERMKDAGYQVVEDGTAQFEMSGVVRTLTYNVKARDEVAISVETQLKDAATGAVLWSGVVDEKKDRFPGVAGDDIADVAAFLRAELGVVTQKTATAIGAVLLAQHPDLFNVAAGSKPIPGVTVLSAPAEAVSAPVVPAAVAPATGAAGAKGVLKITTKPARARIYIGGVYYGLSPLRLELDPGIMAVTAELDHHRNATEKVSVRKGETTELELSLKK
jgi:hypothetical protein